MSLDKNYSHCQSPLAPSKSLLSLLKSLGDQPFKIDPPLPPKLVKESVLHHLKSHSKKPSIKSLEIGRNPLIEEANLTVDVQVDLVEERKAQLSPWLRKYTMMNNPKSK